MARGFIEGEYQDGEIRGLTFLAGMRGMGKTTETARLLSQCAGGALFFDTTGNHPFKGYKTFTQPDDLVKYLKANHNRRFRIRYVTTDEHAEEHFVRVCSIVRWARWMVFAVDEVDTFCGPEHGAKQMPMPLYNLAHFGRHYRVSMLVTARDPASLSIKFRSQCGTMRLFRVDEERYIKYFEGRIGRANAAKLPTLEKYQYLHWESGTSEARLCGGRARVRV